MYVYNVGFLSRRRCNRQITSLECSELSCASECSVLMSSFSFQFWSTSHTRLLELITSWPWPFSTFVGMGLTVCSTLESLERLSCFVHWWLESSVPTKAWVSTRLCSFFARVYESCLWLWPFWNLQWIVREFKFRWLTLSCIIEIGECAIFRLFGGTTH